MRVGSRRNVNDVSSRSGSLRACVRACLQLRKAPWLHLRERANHDANKRRPTEQRIIKCFITIVLVVPAATRRRRFARIRQMITTC